MKYYLIYQITNKVNGMIYIGKHMTENKNDSYMGSGLRIRYAINKYGIENFEKTILFECASEDEMNQKEFELVNEDFIARDDVYNIKVGGEGGWKQLSQQSKSHAAKTRWKNMTQKQRKHSVQAAHIASTGRKHTIEECQKISKTLKETYFNDPSKCGMSGKQHSALTKLKMSASHAGSNNNQFGKIWICNDLTKECKTILKTDPIPNGWRKGRIYKKNSCVAQLV